MHAIERHFLVAAADVVIGSGTRGGNAAAVVRHHLALFRVMQHHKGVAAQAAFHRQHHAFGGSNGNGRIEGIAATLQDAQTDKRRRRVRRRHHAAQAERLRPLFGAIAFRRAESP